MRYRIPGNVLFFSFVFGYALAGMVTPTHASPAHQSAAQAAPPGKDGVAARTPRAPCGKPLWYCGVPKSQQNQALALYKEGNQLFDDSLFLGAVDKYRAALERWDHPSIHYNLMLALVALDRPVEAYESSIAALGHGDKALRPEEYRRARDYQTLLRGRIAVLEVTCNEPGAEVSLDGKPLFRAPGTVRHFVLPGHHDLVASKPEYLTSHQSLLLMPGQPQTIDVSLLPTNQAMVTTRRWPSWHPWAVVGAGVGVGLLGTTLEWRAGVKNRAFRDLFAEECAVPDGCYEPAYSDELAQRQRRYTWYRRLGHSASIAGAATALTGMALVYLNRPERIDNPARRSLFRVSLAPAVRPESAALSVQMDF